MIATTSTDRRELARRTNDGIEVALFWSRSSNQVTVTVLDSRTDEALEFEIDGKFALDAFSHPYAYAARGRVRDAMTPHVAVTR